MVMNSQVGSGQVLSDGRSLAGLGGRKDSIRTVVH
jgi:hypothetical protein